MININEYLLSKKTNKLADTKPEIGKTAYYIEYDEPYEILDFCRKSENRFRSFLYSYDSEGSLEDDDIDRMDNDTLFVAAKSITDKITCVFEWDKSTGLHYK